MPEHAGPVEDFIARAGWQDAQRRRMAGDASARAYTRLDRDGETAVLMDASRLSGPVAETFARLARFLTDHGFSAPRILDADTENGLLLLEDFGTADFATLIDAEPDLQPALYEAAVDMLIDLARVSPPFEVPRSSVHHLATMIDPLFEHYAPAGDTPVREATRIGITTLLESALAQALATTDTLSMRDCHAENLMWLPDRQGIARVGLLDFQDAFVTHPAYDLVSLLQDARRDVPDALAARLVDRFADADGRDAAGFGAAYAVLGLQRNLRIMGIFARLATVERRTRYLEHLPRLWSHVERNLAHPSLERLAQPLIAHVPAPTGYILERLARHADT